MAYMAASTATTMMRINHHERPPTSPDCELLPALAESTPAPESTSEMVVVLVLAIDNTRHDDPALLQIPQLPGIFKVPSAIPHTLTPTQASSISDDISRLSIFLRNVTDNPPMRSSEFTVSLAVCTVMTRRRADFQTPDKSHPFDGVNVSNALT